MDSRLARLRILTEKGNELNNEQVSKFQAKLKNMKSDLYELFHAILSTTEKGQYVEIHDNIARLSAGYKKYSEVLIKYLHEKRTEEVQNEMAAHLLIHVTDRISSKIESATDTIENALADSLKVYQRDETEQKEYMPQNIH